MIPTPTQPKIVREDGNRAVLEIEGLYPGYGHTLGNALRRVLLSSLPGAAVTSIKIDGVGHEFTAIEGVMEDVVDLTLNVKQMRFRLHEDGPFTIALSVSGEREATGGDFKAPSQVEIVSPAVHIATLSSKKSRLILDAVVESGVGYVPVEARSKEKVEVGTIALDAAFSPVRHVNYEVENMRVGDRTDYNRLLITIETDGSVTPRDAYRRAAEILTAQFSALGGEFSSPLPAQSDGGAQYQDQADTVALREKTEDAPMRMKIDDLKLSSRTHNALREAGIKTVGGLARKREEVIADIEGMGEKGIQEVKKALGNLGIILKQ